MTRPEAIYGTLYLNDIGSQPAETVTSFSSKRAESKPSELSAIYIYIILFPTQ
jgi:hypothetical protein